MIIKNVGKIIDDLYMVGHPAMPVYLLDGPKPVIFDAGLAFLGRLYVEGIREIIRKRDLHYCFLSHSHFDHCGSVAMLKNAFPALKVVASENVKRVLERPNALALIGKLSRAAEQLSDSIGIKPEKFEPFEPFEVDITLKDMEIIELDHELTVQAFETPGHTRDSLSYFIPQKKVLLCSEAAGIPDATGYIVSEALVDYDQYYESLQRLSEVDCEVSCLGHRQALTGRDAREYFQKSMTDCRSFLNLVETALNEYDGDVQKVISRIKAIEYDPVPEPKQIELAYLLNMEAKVKVIKRRMENRSGNIGVVN
jgi:glyoxylase-like metal-dependent hydrolase (beta-lactamase superfamily II)